MFYKKEQIDDLLKCPHCKERYFEPKSLPCGETLCNSCIFNLFDDKIKGIDCPICSEFHSSPKQESFPINKKLSKLLEINSNEVYRSKIVDEFKSKLEKIKSESNNLLENLNNSSGKVKEYCEFVRDDVQLIKESTIEFIIKYTDEFMLEINKYEADCLENLDKKQDINQEVDKTKQEADEFYIKWVKYLNNFKIDDREISEASLQASSLIKNLTKIEKELKYVTFSGKMINFDVNLKQITSDILGVIRYEQMSKIFFKSNNFNALIQIKDVIQGEFSTNQISIIQINHNMFAVFYVNENNNQYQNQYDYDYEYQYHLNVYFVDQTGALINSSTNIDLNQNQPFYNQLNAQYIQLKVSHYNTNIVVFVYGYCPEYGDVYQQIITIEYPSLKIKQINERNNSCLSFLTCNSSSIYCVYRQGQFRIDVYDWNLTYIKTIGQSNNQNSPFYIPEITQLQVNEKEIFLMNNLYSVRIVDIKTGTLKKIFQLKENNFILFQETSLISFNASTKRLIISDYVDNKTEEKELEECNASNLSLINISTDQNLLFFDNQNYIAYSYHSFINN